MGVVLIICRIKMNIFIFCIVNPQLLREWARGILKRHIMDEVVGEGAPVGADEAIGRASGKVFARLEAHDAGQHDEVAAIAGFLEGRDAARAADAAEGWAVVFPRRLGLSVRSSSAGRRASDGCSPICQRRT